jgi:hypothetical protein
MYNDNSGINDDGLDENDPIGSDPCVMTTHKVNDAGLEKN